VFRVTGVGLAQLREGAVMVGSLNRISPLLTLIPVPDGDHDAHIRSLHVAINLRRLGCSGRSAVTLHYPEYAQSSVCPCVDVCVRECVSVSVCARSLETVCGYLCLCNQPAH
jgi:hypothetical protein